MIRAAAAIVVLILTAIASAALAVRVSALNVNALAAAQAAEAPEIARLYRSQFRSLADAAPTIVKHVTRPGLHVALRDARSGSEFNEQGRLANRFGPAGVGVHGPGPLPPAFGPSGADRLTFLVATLAGETVQRAPIRGGDIMIFPDPHSLLGVLRTVSSILTLVFALGFSGLWFYVRGVRRAALRPLRETTLSLQRLAERDFTPRTIVAGEGTAYEELAHAYNAAVEAVSSSFAERRLAESEMQRFIADAGHELRTPLTIVMGYLDIIESGALTDARIAARVIIGMRNESVRMRKLIEKLIILARMETPSDLDTRTDLDLVSLVARVIESLEPVSVQPIEVVGVPFAHVFASEDDLAEAISNIVENAIKYAPLSPIIVRIEHSVERISVSVSDRGPGMSTDEQRNAFERFYRGERRGEVVGSGLGLAIAKRAVEQARGTIDCKSVPGAGTTFTIGLPPTSIGGPGESAIGPGIADRYRLAHFAAYQSHQDRATS